MVGIGGGGRPRGAPSRPAGGHGAARGGPARDGEVDELREELVTAKWREEKKDGALQKTREDLERSSEENVERAREVRDYKELNYKQLNLLGKVIGCSMGKKLNIK